MGTGMGMYLRSISTIFRLRFKQIVLNEWVLFALVLEPLFVAVLAVYMLQGTEHFLAIYVVVGSGLVGLWSATLYEGGNNVLFERFLGTLEAIVGSPTPLRVVVTANVLAHTVLALCSMVISYALVLLLFGFQVTVIDPLAFALSILLATIAFVSTGVMLAPFIAINLGNHIWTNAFQYPICILGGFLLPITLLPGWAQPFSYLLAPYWAANALHASSSGQVPIDQIWLSWGMTILLSLIYLALARWLFQRLLYRARVEGTLGLQ